MLAFVSLPFFFESVLHRSQVETGLLMTPWPLAVGIGAPIAGRLADKVSAAVLGAAGLVVLCAGLALLAGLPENPTAAEIAWRMALCGLGFGFFQAPNNRSMLSAAPLARSGAAGGMLATARLTGQTIGAILAAISFRIGGHSETIALGWRQRWQPLQRSPAGPDCITRPARARPSLQSSPTRRSCAWFRGRQVPLGPPPSRCDDRRKELTVAAIRQCHLTDRRTRRSKRPGDQVIF